MGYRHYFYKLDRNLYNEMKDLSPEELIEKYANITYRDKDNILHKDASLSMVLNTYGEEIFAFGKLYWDDTVERINSHGSLFFEKEETNKALADYNAHIISKEGFLEAIDIIRDKVNSIYSPFLKKPLEDYEEDEFIDLKDYKDLSEDDKIEIIDAARDYAFYWFENRSNILNLKKGSNKLINSWIYEHELFNLISEYNHFDFDNYVLIFLGW